MSKGIWRRLGQGSRPKLNLFLAIASFEVYSATIEEPINQCVHFGGLKLYLLIPSWHHIQKAIREIPFLIEYSCAQLGYQDALSNTHHELAALVRRPSV